MPINTVDGTFGLDCWIDPTRSGDADQILYSENAEELRAEARRLVAGGRYRLCELYRYDYRAEEWLHIEDIDVADVA